VRPITLALCKGGRGNDVDTVTRGDDLRAVSTCRTGRLGRSIVLCILWGDRLRSVEVIVS